MWPPTIVGRRARSPNVTARMMPSGSQTTSSSINRTYVAVPLRTRLELAAGVAAGAAEVALLDDAQLVAEGGRGLGEELAVDDLLGALVHDEDRVEVGPRARSVVAELADAAWRRSRGGSSW